MLIFVFFTHLKKKFFLSFLYNLEFLLIFEQFLAFFCTYFVSLFFRLKVVPVLFVSFFHLCSGGGELEGGGDGFGGDDGGDCGGDGGVVTKELQGLFFKPGRRHPYRRLSGAHTLTYEHDEEID